MQLVASLRIFAYRGQAGRTQTDEGMHTLFSKPSHAFWQNYKSLSFRFEPEGFAATCFAELNILQP